MAVESLSFQVEDDATRHNLTRLFAISQKDCGDGSAKIFEALVGGAILSFKMLPAVVADRMRTLDFYVGSSYDRVPPERRIKKWKQLSAELQDDLRSIASDQTLLRDDAGLLAQRPSTKGERIIAICEELDVARREGRSMDGLARRLEIEAQSTPASHDGKTLVRLLSMKRIPDIQAHRYEIVRIISHARLIASGLHHLS